MSQPTKQTLIAYVTEYHRLVKAIKVLSIERNEVFEQFEHLAWRLRTAYYVQDNGQLVFYHIGAMDKWGVAHDTLDLLALKFNRKSQAVEQTRQDFLMLQLTFQVEASDHRTYLAKGQPIPLSRKQWYIWE